jgi:hypothetical protein
MLVIMYTGAGGSPVSIDFDCASSEDYQATANVSDHPVETGPDVSDYVRANNDTITVEATATNAPIEIKTFGMSGATMATGPIALDLGNGQSISASVFKSSQAFDRVRAIDAALLALRDNGTVCTVQLTLRTLQNCVVQSYRVKLDETTGDALAVTIDFRKIRIASTTRVAAQTTTRRAQRTVSRGKQPVQPDTGGSFLADVAGV